MSANFVPNLNADDIIVTQTHLSYVCLCGDFAFKMKKSVNLGPPFTDQTQLAERKRLCEEELKKNRGEP